MRTVAATLLTTMLALQPGAAAGAGRPVCEALRFAGSLYQICGTDRFLVGLSLDDDPGRTSRLDLFVWSKAHENVVFLPERDVRIGVFRPGRRHELMPCRASLSSLRVAPADGFLEVLAVLGEVLNGDSDPRRVWLRESYLTPANLTAGWRAELGGGAEEAVAGGEQTLLPDQYAHGEIHLVKSDKSCWIDSVAIRIGNEELLLTREELLP